MRPLPDLVVVIAASLKSNALGRALSLAELIAGDVRVEIWGPPTRSFWAESQSVPIFALSQRQLNERRALLNEDISHGRVIFWASKCYPFAVKAVRGLPDSATIIADFDDHDVALAREFRSHSWRNRLLLNRFRAGAPERVARSQRYFLRVSDAVTVSSFALAIRLGINKEITRIPHARPDLASTEAFTRPKDSIGFLGTMRAHKGYAEICSALDAYPALKCVTFDQAFFARDKKSQWHFLPPKTPLVQAYQHIELAVLPMSKSPGAQFQLPAKAIDAAAAAVPIAATPTPAIVEYFGDSVIAISDWRNLGVALQEWRDTGELRGRALAVRQIWENEFSYESVRKKVLSLLESTMRRGPA